MTFSLFLFLSLAMNDNNSEFIAIELEISEIDGQINRLRQQRFHLVKRQKKLKETIEQNQQSTTSNVNDQWKRTGSSKQRNTFLVILFSYLDFPWSSKVKQIRTDVFKMNTFRQWQLETINATLSGHDCILIMPTGGGKSLCYQLPAVISDGKIKHFFVNLNNLISSQG